MRSERAYVVTDVEDKGRTGWGTAHWEILDVERPYGKMKTVRIELDSGQTIWGYECWWVTEETYNSAPKVGTGE